VPTKEYFEELFRVSKNQIIWGGNYFDLPPNRGFIIWDKMVYIPTMSQIEQAFVSEDRLPKLIKINNNDFNRIHLTQKPVKLYEWLLKNYAKQGDKILDTHGGSLSIALAVHNVNHIDKMDLTLDVCELDTDYYNDGVTRYKNHIKQLTIF